MARFYSNENFPLPVVLALRSLGHDIVTSNEAANANQQIPDADVLRYAIEQKRAVLTINRRDFILLHKRSPKHFGVVVCTLNPNFKDQAVKIEQAVKAFATLENQLVRVNRG